jgi:hypothetical protein
MSEPKTLLLYGILGSPWFPRESVSGVQGRPLQLLRVEEAGLWAATSTLSAAAALHPPKTADALAYHRALQALHRDAAVLPLRYGTVLGGDEEVRALLVANQQEYRGLLARIAGCHEFGIHVPSCDQATASPPSIPSDRTSPRGSAYLRTRQQHYQREEAAIGAAEALVARLAVALGPWARERQAQYGPRPSARLSGQVLSVSFLVPHEKELEFRRAFAGLQSVEPQPLKLLGPWPPYSFLSPHAA